MKLQKLDYANIIIYNDENKILMQKRHKNAKIYPDHWGLFGGKIELNENYTEAIIREIKEELDYKLIDFKLVFHLPYVVENISYGEWYIFIHKIHIKKIQTLKLLEGEDWGWYEFDYVLNNLKINPDMKNVINKTKNIILGNKFK